MTLPILNHDISDGRVLIECGHVQIDVDVLAAGWGLCVVRWNGYAVTHISTGMALRPSCHFDTLADARAAMVELAPLFPWQTKCISDLSKDEKVVLRDRIDNIARKFPRRTEDYS